MLVRPANMDGAGGCGMSHSDAIKLTIPQALFYINERGKADNAREISKGEAEQISKGMSAKEVDRVRREMQARIDHYTKG